MKIKLVPPYSKSLSIHNEVLSGFSTCCPDEQSPAGWALWCPEWDRWCPHPGDNKKRREAERKESTNLKKEQKYAAPADVTRIWVIASTWLWHHSKNIWREAGEEKKMEKVSGKNRKRQIRKEADDYRRKKEKEETKFIRLKRVMIPASSTDPLDFLSVRLAEVITHTPVLMGEAACKESHDSSE